MSSASDLTNTFTGMSLGEKKMCKDAIAGDEYSGAVKSLSGLGMTLVVDSASVGKYVTGDNRKYLNLVYKQWAVEHAATIVTFCKNADYKEALCDAVTTVLIVFEKENDSNGDKATYSIASKTLRIVLNGYYTAGHSPEADRYLTKFLEKAL